MAKNNIVLKSSFLPFSLMMLAVKKKVCLMPRWILSNLLSVFSLLPIFIIIYRELMFQGKNILIFCHSSLNGVSCKVNDVILTPPPFTLTLCQPIRRCCSVWRSSMRRCLAGRATPRLLEHLRSCRRTPRNMSASLRSMWECLV